LSGLAARRTYIFVNTGENSLKQIRLPGVFMCMDTGLRRAFTLIELLVVIAIIGILAAFLMPALAKAKNQASKVTDLNNLKQIMVAVNLYTSDDGDMLPPPNWGVAETNGWLYALKNSPPAGPGDLDMTGGLLWSLLHQPKIYVCPQDDLQMWHYSNHYGVNMQRPQQLSSYSMNGAVVGYSSTGVPLKLAVFRPTDCAFWETDETEPYYFNDAANKPSEGVSARHLQGGIQALFDGSVNYVRLADWYQDVADPNRNRLWCYPGSPDGR
jgi:prepilin-type N-terminal cleavage/methylation domain-containing protein